MILFWLQRVLGFQHQVRALEHDLSATQRQVEVEKAMSRMCSETSDSLRLRNERLEARLDTMQRAHQALLDQQEQDRKDQEEMEIQRQRRHQLLNQATSGYPPPSSRKESLGSSPLFTGASSLLDAAVLLESSSGAKEAPRREPLPLSQSRAPAYGWPPHHPAAMNGDTAAASYWAAIERPRGVPPARSPVYASSQRRGSNNFGPGMGGGKHYK